MIGMTFCGYVAAKLSRVSVSTILVQVYTRFDLLEIFSHSGNYLVFGCCQSTDSCTFVVYNRVIKVATVTLVFLIIIIRTL